MIGKKNIVFGFLYLVLTAALGPLMVTQLGTAEKAQTDKQAIFSDLELLASSGFEDQKTLEKMSGEDIAKTNSNALLALNKQLNARAPIDAIKGGPHTHGNLESVLNIVVGLVLCFIALKPLYKQIISWTFIAGAILHSGMLYLVVVFQQAWAGQILNTGIGPILILIGLLLAGLASAFGLRAELVKDGYTSGMPPL